MTLDNHTHLYDLFNEAVELSTQARVEFLKKVGKKDVTLRHGRADVLNAGAKSLRRELCP